MFILSELREVNLVFPYFLSHFIFPFNLFFYFLFLELRVRVKPVSQIRYSLVVILELNSVSEVQYKNVMMVDDGKYQQE